MLIIVPEIGLLKDVNLLHNEMFDFCHIFSVRLLQSNNKGIFHNPFPTYLYRGANNSGDDCIYKI